MPEPIEVEVLEIDGAPPPPRGEEPRPDQGDRPLWRTVLTWLSVLDRQWWPLWVVLGILVIGFVVIAAVIFAACWMVFAALRAILRFLTGVGVGPSRTSLRQTRN